MSHWDQIRSYSGITAIVSLYGIASLLVVLVGPSVGLGLTEQIIIIALLLLTWPFAVWINNRRARRQALADAGGAMTVTTGDLGGRQVARVPSRVRDELARGAEEVVQWLRQTKLSLARRGEPAYALPWFAVVGAPGSGKTSLLLSSGLDFHALPSQRQADQNVLYPTRDVDWRVTNWSVLLDTTGRYQTETPDGDEWTALIEAIRKHRKRRPLDGLVIAADASRLLDSGEQEIEHQAKILRGRLDQLNAAGSARFPVYLVFTHVDSIPGFYEFFSITGPAERGQVWGATIPLDRSSNAHARFDDEYDELYDTLMRYRLLRLSVQESHGRQLMVFDFPMRFAEARRKLGMFASALFRPNPFSETPFFRGFYFANSAAANGSRPGGFAPAGEPYEEVPVAGEGFFSELLFNDVLKRDKDLAASFQAGQKKPHRLRDALLVTAGVAALFIIAALIISFANNASLVDEARRAGSRVAAYSKDASGKDAAKDFAGIHEQLKDMDKLRDVLTRIEDYDRDWPPFFPKSLFHRFGLYSGSPLRRYLRSVYFEAISRRFFNSVTKDLEADIESFSVTVPPPAADAPPTPPKATGAEADEERLGQYYDLLKVYLMVSRYPERAEPSLLRSRLWDYWKKVAPPEDESLAFNQLEFYADEAAAGDAPHINAKEETLKLACVKLESFPPVMRYYKRSIDETSRTTSGVTLDEVIGGRKGVIEGSAQVRGAFTIDGYKKMLVKIEAAKEGISGEDWVCPGGPKSKDQAGDVDKLKSQYARQYVDAWRQFLKNVRVVEYNPDQAVITLDELSKNDSPLARVLGAVAKQTNLSRPGSFWARINPFSVTRSEVGSSVAKEVENEFQTIIKFMSGEGGLSQYRQTLTDARAALVEATADGWPQAAKRMLAPNDPKGLSKFETQVKPAVEEVKGKSGVGVEAAALLEQPLGNLRKVLIGSNLDQIEAEWREKLLPAAQRLEQGYPFSSATGDASLSDMTSLLNPVDGKFWVFFRQNLQSNFRDADQKWKLPEGGKIKFSDEFVNYLNNARRLTETIFPSTSRSPSFDFVLSLQAPASTSSTIDLQVEGRRITSGDPPLSMKWTGIGGGSINVSQGLGQPQPRTFGGWWALFKMFEEGGGSSTRGSDSQYSLRWTVGGSTVSAKLQPPSTSNNPFEMRLFRELRAPQNIR